MLNTKDFVLKLKTKYVLNMVHLRYCHVQTITRSSLSTFRQFMLEDDCSLSDTCGVVNKTVMVNMYLSQLFKFHVYEFCIKCNYFIVFHVFQRFLNSTIHLVTRILSYKGTIFNSFFIVFHFIWFNSISYLLITIL